MAILNSIAVRQDKLADIASAIKRMNSFIITAHTGIDGDALGSMTALGTLLRKYGKKVILYYPESIPDDISFLPVEILSGDIPHAHYDCVILLECVTPERTPGGLELFNKTSFSINLDHHPDNTINADMHYVDPSASALGEVIFELVKELGFDLDKESATMLYTAIASDSGSFRYSSTKERTLLIAAELVKHGAEVFKVARNLYFEKPIERVKLIGHLLLNLKSELSGRLYWVAITNDLLNSLRVDLRYAGNMIEELNIISGTELFVVFTENAKNSLKVSLRSMNPAFSVRKFASFYGGGGHDAAAGCTLPAADDKTIKNFIEHLIEFTGS